MQWIRTADRFQQRYGSPHLFTTCRLALGSVLFFAGRWEEAEAELRRAIGLTAGSADPAVRTQALAKLAELRVAQGRLEEADGFLVGGGEGAPYAFARAALLLQVGSWPAAATQLRRRLTDLDPTSTEAVRLADLLVQAELAANAESTVRDSTRRP